ncbi:N-6 DNA methylase [Bradyrhizobium tropiciagri]|uniref:Eco57I restriction-modification methylase domain-containing protein n=1 Tax=Bradyrhizobium tropiciagri TaxID=312253 RepID=UPI001BADD044|nr:N-6 DNA methylase [Bradyrhizobium tropiciagri]MBR0900975.1 N-6 DNA methylase [Bradyrhizobium tropiciagri]
MNAQHRKTSGAYYTPDAVVATLLQWAVRDPADRLLDPSCGDGRFIAGHQNAVGIEQDPAAVGTAISRAPWALVHEGDLFAWAANTSERFECAAGNPPFIRYQTFKGAARERALELCQRLGAKFSGLTSSWAPFLVATASLLKPDGRMAFVVPAEIGHAPYASPLLEYLVGNFGHVHVIAVKGKLFPDLSEDCWLLYADGFGGTTASFLFSAVEQFKPGGRPPRSGVRVSVSEWRSRWNRRLRPFLAHPDARALYEEIAFDPHSRRLGDVASVGIGYVSGANDFFHLRPSEAERHEIPSDLLQPSVRNGRALPAGSLTRAIVRNWERQDEPMLLLRLSKDQKLPASVRRYLDTEAGREAREAYKCRVRDPWFAVPDVQIPDFFLTYMSGRAANLVRNAAGCTCTNSLHAVRVRDKTAMIEIVRSWSTPFTQLSCEFEGHPLGGGMLKLEPREAAQIVVSAPSRAKQLSSPIFSKAVETMQHWRHYAAIQ